MIDRLLEHLRSVLGPTILAPAAEVLRKLGYYGLPVAGALGCLFAATLGIRHDNLTLFLFGVAWLVVVLVAQYLAGLFLDAGDALVQATPSQLSSSSFLNATSLLAVLVGAFGLLGGLFYAIRTENLLFLWAGLGLFVVAEFLAYLALNPASTLVTLNPKAVPTEEALGILLFGIKAGLRLVPVTFGTGIVLGSLDLTFTFYQAFFERWNVYAAMATLTKSAERILAAAALPMAAYLLFVGACLGVALLRAVLTLPRKLELLSRQLPGSPVGMAGASTPSDDTAQ